MTEDFEKILHKLGEVLLSQVKSEISGRPWSSAFLDVRFDEGGRSWMSKVRVIIPDAEKNISENDE
jgi:hypothetical protein